MSREALTMLRTALVWLAVTVGGGVVLAASVPLVEPQAWGAPSSFADLLVRVSGLALVVAVLRIWVVTTVTVVHLVRGVAPSPAGATRRLVLVACGAALSAVAMPSATTSASAAEGDSILEGLRLPERAVATSRAPSTSVDPTRPARSARPASTARAAEHLHVVEPGESLWTIADATSPPGTDLDRRWRAIWAANRAVVGADPDLILPGQRLWITDGTPVTPHNPTTAGNPRTEGNTQTGDRS